jgi:hypothetical protein
MARWLSRMLLATAVAILVAAPALAGSGSGSGGGGGCGSAPTSFPEGYPVPSEITLDQHTLAPGQSTGGTITLDRPALSGGTPAFLYQPPVNVTLSPRCVLIPAGRTTGRFTLSLGRALRAPQSFWIYTSFDVAFRQTSDMTAVFVEPAAAPAPPPPPPPPPLGAEEPATGADTVAVTRAEWTRSRRRLTVSATSTSTTARLTTHVTSTGATIGTLRHQGSGRFSGTFSNITASPGQITVRSTLGGSATATVVTR